MDNIRRKMIARYKRGGLKEYEKDISPKMGNFRIEQIYYIDTVTKEKLKWVYVGDHWWCRKKNNKYEFARLMAMVNENKEVNEIVGLWDARRHEHKPEPPIVFDKESRKEGVITDYSGVELWVKWSDGRIEPISDGDRIEFKYIEDFRKYSRIFNRGKKNVKKIL
jgi:hypothetical protein